MERILCKINFCFIIFGSKNTNPVSFYVAVFHIKFRPLWYISPAPFFQKAERPYLLSSKPIYNCLSKYIIAESSRKLRAPM